MSGEGVVPAKDNAGEEAPIPEKNGSSKFTVEELEHIRIHHLLITISEDRRTLEIAVSRTCKEQLCPVPDNVSFFYCRFPPCPR